jgi:predicted adenine nucleotide alpha hydrolase (AANH) superfamily ATPase
MKRAKLLLHICCAPDATVAYQKLDASFSVSGIFYNPNIYPLSEYDKRYESVSKLASLWDFNLLTGEYRYIEWLNAVKGFETEKENGRRCCICIFHNLLYTAEVAKENSFTWFSTSLFTSRRKDIRMVEEIGYRVQKETGVHFYYEPFRKNGGFDESVRISNALGLYRQEYCGCAFSLRGIFAE